MWKVPIEEFKNNLWKLYEQDPDLWKAVLFSLLYRTWWWMLNLMWSVAEFIVSTTNWLLFDNRSLKDSFDIARWSLKWNIDFHIKTMKDIVSWLPVEQEFKDKFESIETELKSFNKNAKIVKAFNIARQKKLKDWENFYDVVKTEYKNLFPSDNVDDILNDFRNITTKKWFRTNLTSRLKWVWLWLDLEFNNIRAIFWKTFLWNNSTTFVINNLSKRIQGLNSYLIDTIREDGLFTKARSQISKLWLFSEWMKLEYAWDKAIFRFKNVETAKDFAKNLKTLLQSSPETIKNLIWHAPIIAIAWIDLSTNKPLSENIKDLIKDLSYWFPFFGAWTILRDWLWKNHFDPVKSSVWSALFVWDIWFAIKAFKKWEFLEFMAKPILDVSDLIWMWIRWVVNLGKIWADGVKLVSQWKLTTSELSKLLEKTNFSKLW